MATTPELIAALNRRYPQSAGQWANVVEFEGIDFLSVACWASKSYVVHGHEIKVSRSDWLRELKKGPTKSYKGRSMCDMWWLAAPLDVAKEEEIPEGWGFLEWNGYSFRVVKQSPVLRPIPKRNSLNPYGPDHETGTDYAHFARMSFAMLARRYAYAKHDRDALLSAVDQPAPYLDVAATATGRFTSKMRQDQAEFARRQREYRKKYRQR